MKKFFALMLMAFFMLSANAQLIVDFTDGGRAAIIPGRVKVDISMYPGYSTYRVGYTIQENMTRFLTELRRSNPEEYVRQTRLAAAQGISVPMGGAIVGGAVVGGVYGDGLQVSEGNLLTTYGSGVYASYDTGSNTVAISGDPLMAVGRTLDYLGGKLSSKKKRAAKAAKAAAAQQQNVVVVYVDSATGKVVKTSQAPAQQATQTRFAQPQAQQTRSAQPATM
jgi:hypothetical protein